MPELELPGSFSGLFWLRGSSSAHSVRIAFTLPTVTGKSTSEPSFEGHTKSKSLDHFVFLHFSFLFCKRRDRQVSFLYSCWFSPLSAAYQNHDRVGGVFLPWVHYNPGSAFWTSDLLQYKKPPSDWVLPLESTNREHLIKGSGHYFLNVFSSNTDILVKFKKYIQFPLILLCNFCLRVLHTITMCC